MERNIKIMDVQVYLPQNAVLQKHIELYYFLNTTDSKFNTKYYAFPTIATPLNIHKNVETKIERYSTLVAGSPNKNYVSLIQGMREFPLFVNLRGRLDKITIIFKPLGINNFLDKSFLTVCRKDSQLFTEWDGKDGYKDFLEGFYGTENQLERIKVLEDFLLSIYRPLETYDLLEKIIELLINFSEEKPIENIAAEVGVNVRTLNRLFKKNIGISPVGFKKIARFRHSLNNKLFGEQFKRLTDIGYESNFCDQSYFINVYQKMTGSNPKNFFNTVQKIADDKILFQFVKK